MKFEDLLSQLRRMAELHDQERRAVEAEKKKMNVPALNAKIRHLEAELFEVRIAHQ
jgi:hypothetical protein